MRRVRANRAPGPVRPRQLVSARRPQRRPRVVRHLARPDELPERGEDVLRREARRVDEVSPEERALGQGCPDRGRRLASPAAPPPPAARGARASSRKYMATRSRPAPTQTTSPDAHSTSRSAGRNPATRRGSTSLSQSVAGSATPCSGTSASRSPCRRPMPCQEGRKRPKAACSAGSTSRRSTASVARRIRRSTSVSHHSRSEPPGRSSPRTSSSARSSAASSPSTRASSRSNRDHQLGRRERPVRPRVPAQQLPQRMLDRARGRPAGTPPGGAAPRASRTRPASSIAASSSSSPRRTRTARRSRMSVSANPRSYSPSSKGPARRRTSCSSSTFRGVGRSDASTCSMAPEVEELAELLDAHELSEQIAVERQRLRTPLLGRRVVLVHVCGDVVEEERRGERATPTPSRPRRGRASASGSRAGSRGARAGRRRPAGTRDTTRARSGTAGTGGRPAAGSAPSGAAARAVCAVRVAGGG